ncbi:hypothetical protein QNH23_04055 [Siminovitchia fortis]|uniref:hypothetical protein n=1 Tax=Siminovitchia fortis TaxID=254758 RepID=UPI0024C1EBFF|nr:hypothetical protein [Siminovitchia fortis]WHY82567.1 hypothetical protein QNH23_04055 [Siminovitchia fortis]
MEIHGPFILGRGKLYPICRIKGFLIAKFTKFYQIAPELMFSKFTFVIWDYFAINIQSEKGDANGSKAADIATQILHDKQIY